MMSVDARTVLGDFILSSALADWSQTYDEIFDRVFTGSLGDQAIREYKSFEFITCKFILVSFSSIVLIR
jgi:hypothetical protein